MLTPTGVLVSRTRLSRDSMGHAVLIARRYRVESVRCLRSARSKWGRGEFLRCASTILTSVHGGICVHQILVLISVVTSLCALATGKLRSAFRQAPKKMKIFGREKVCCNFSRQQQLCSGRDANLRQKQRCAIAICARKIGAELRVKCHFMVNETGEWGSAGGGREMGDTGFEPVTSCVSCMRSNQLS